MDLQLTSKRAIITGGSKGLGLAAAHALAAEGVDIVIASRNQDVAKAAAADVAARSGRRVVAIPTDTGDDASVRALVERAVAELGGIDILVNSASNQQVGRGYQRLADTTDQVFWDDVNIKVVGYLRTARAVAPHLVAQGWGRIINISGLGARQAQSIVRTIRNVSVSALTKNLADELGPHGVNVTVVHPGTTRTETLSQRLQAQADLQGVDVAELERTKFRNSIGRIVDASEVADVITFLASPRSAAINGDAIAVGGGQPGVVHY